MASKDAKIQVALEFQANNASLSKATRQIGNELNTLQRKTATVASSMTSFVPAFAAVGAGAFSALTFAGRAAVQFQDSFAGVRKTLNFTGSAAKDQEGNFKRLAQGLIDISKSTPMAANELAKIGEIGGQLGISAGSIEKFTKTISQLTVATTMSAEEASFALSRLAAITRLPERNLGNLASVLVRLGNEFAATESEIVNTAMKIASALELLESSTSNSAADSLALAAALKQVGQQTQAGSTAVARSLDIMATAVLQGGRELSIFAKVAGMTSDSFRTLAEASPANAFVAFLEGLQAVGNAGGDTVQLLDELGLGQQRTLRALRSMALASADVKVALSSANEEFALNNALQTEAEKRYETVVSQLGILRNNIQAVGITTGDALLGPLNEVIDVFRTISGGTTADDLKSIGKGFAAVAFSVNALFTARSKLGQLNQLAMEAGMQGSGLDGKIRFGDATRGLLERGDLNRANFIKEQGQDVDFNRKNFLAQQASLGVGTAGMRNILDSSEMMGVDIFDQEANKDLVGKFGSESDMFAADAADESLGLTTKEQNRLNILQAINEEQTKFIADSKELNEGTAELVALEKKITKEKEEQVAAQDKLDRAINQQKSRTKGGNLNLNEIDVTNSNKARADAVNKADEFVFGLHDGKDGEVGQIYGDMREDIASLELTENELIQTQNKIIQQEEKLKNVTHLRSEEYDTHNEILQTTIRKEKELLNTLDALNGRLEANDDALQDTGKSGQELSNIIDKVIKSTKGLQSEQGFEKLEQDASEATAKVKTTSAAIDELTSKNERLSRTQQKGRFMRSVADGGVIKQDSFGNQARSLRTASLALANYGNNGKQVNNVLVAMGKLLFRKRKNLLAAAQATQAAAGGTQAYKLAVQSLANALTSAKAALASFLKMSMSMVAFTAVMAFFTKLMENAKKTARAIEEVGQAVKGIIDIQSELDFQELQLDVLNKALDQEMKKNAPDKNLLQTYRTQIDNLTKGINGANAQVEESVAALGENLLLGTTEQGTNVEARIDAISKAIGTTFDKEEFFTQVGKSILDFENITATSLLTGMQNLQETRDELAALGATGDPVRIAELEQELAVFKALDDIASNTDLESFLKSFGEGFTGGTTDSFLGSITDFGNLDGELSRSLGLTFEKLANGSTAVFRQIQDEYTSTYLNIANTSEPLHIFAPDTEINDKILDDLSAYLLLSDTLREQATGKDAIGAMKENSTFIEMQNESLLQQLKFLKANGIILQDVDPYKDRGRAIKEVTQGTALYQEQQIAQAQQAANTLGILEYQMSKFEKELNKSLEKAASGVASVFSAMPVTIKKGVAAMVEEMVIKEARLKNFENNVKRLATIAPMTAKQMADQGIAAARQVEQLLKDPVAAFSIEASLSRMAPFVGEDLGITTEEIERMQEAGLRLGDSASEGIIVGLQQRAPELESTFVSMMDNAIQATKYFIKSSSPSKLTAELLGEPITDGIIVGIEENAVDVQHALTSVVNDAIEGTVELMTELESVSELQSAAQVMFAVTGGARALTAANYAVQKSEQSLMATRRKQATLNERILKNQIALQKAELTGRKNNITMSEQASVLQKKIAIEEMQRKAKGQFNASERKAIADAEKQLDDLKLAAEAGIVTGLDVEVAEERLADLKGTNKTLDEQRLQILELAMAEEDLEETNIKIREVDEELIRLREENITLLDESANKTYELKTAFDQLEASQEAVVTQELEYSKVREEFLQFVEAAPELFDALIAGYGGVGTVVNATRDKVLALTSSVETGADKAIQKLIDVVTQANMTATNLNSLDLLTDTVFDPSGTSGGAKQANSRATVEDFKKFIGMSNPLTGLLDNIGTQGSAIEQGKVDSSSREVFSSTEDFLRSQTALRRIDEGDNISFRDFANAISGFLGINTKLDSAGNINFSEEGLSRFLSADDVKKVSAGAHTAGKAGFGTAVLGGTDTDLMSVGGDDLAEGGNYGMVHDYTRPIPGRNQEQYNLKSGTDIVRLIRDATGASLGKTQNKTALEDALEVLKLGGTGVDPNTDQEALFQQKKGDAHYSNILYTNVLKILDSLGDNRFNYVLKRKYGGGVKPFQRALVGEYGPEFVTALPQGGLRVTPQGSERGGSINVENVNVNVTGVPTDPVQARKAAVQIQKALVKLDKEGTSGTGLLRR
jgi:TP901 family phage tail tape measure protein